MYENVENNLKKIEKAIELHVKAYGVDLVKLNFLTNSLMSNDLLSGKYIITVQISKECSFGIVFEEIKR